MVKKSHDIYIYIKQDMRGGAARFLHGEEPGPPSLCHTYTEYWCMCMWSEVVTYY